jgi:hypothetical protein
MLVLYQTGMQAMTTTLFQLQDLLNAFQKKKVLTLDELLRQTGCSTMTVWRLLQPHGYFTSYNHNARYYTIAGVPKFDQHGLWDYRDARFSKWGSLTKTIIGLVQESPDGLTAEQLQQRLHLKNVRPALTRLIQNESLTREKIDRRFVYFPRQQDARRRQLKQRKEEAQQARAQRALPAPEQIIALLVEIIRHPHDTPRQWVRRQARQGVPLRTADIQHVLDHYQIDPKKGHSSLIPTVR